MNNQKGILIEHDSIHLSFRNLEKRTWRNKKGAVNIKVKCNKDIVGNSSNLPRFNFCDGGQVCRLQYITAYSRKTRKVSAVCNLLQ